MLREPGAGSSWLRRVAEGLTIVASILLALAAESVWSYRGDRADERRLLEGLRAEFVEVVVELESDLTARREIISRVRILSDARLGGSVPVDSIPLIVSALLNWRFYTPGHATLDDVLSSGRLDLIRSDDVRRSLMAYVQQRGRIGVFDERERDFVSAHLEPFLLERVSLDELLNGATASESSRFVSLVSDDAFGGLIELRLRRTLEASTFSRLVRRAAMDVQESLANELRDQHLLLISLLILPHVP